MSSQDGRWLKCVCGCGNRWLEPRKKNGRPRRYFSKVCGQRVRRRRAKKRQQVLFMMAAAILAGCPSNAEIPDRVELEVTAAPVELHADPVVLELEVTAAPVELHAEGQLEVTAPPVVLEVTAPPVELEPAAQPELAGLVLLDTGETDDPAQAWAEELLEACPGATFQGWRVVPGDADFTVRVLALLACP